MLNHSHRTTTDKAVTARASINAGGGASRGGGRRASPRGGGGDHTGPIDGGGDDDGDDDHNDGDDDDDDGSGTPPIGRRKRQRAVSSGNGNAISRSPLGEPQQVGKRKRARAGTTWDDEEDKSGGERPRLSSLAMSEPVRRSSRQIVKPLAFWRNERVKYALELGETGVPVLAMKTVLLSDGTGAEPASSQGLQSQIPSGRRTPSNSEAKQRSAEQETPLARIRTR
ncbi:hypothetical protein DFJ73DRAFT_250931 [Zopfochytrium polystomum]|nr:hypothetical protein DFJ73DRAFT_250931 [Zopfochytrium polystomum]